MHEDVSAGVEPAIAAVLTLPAHLLVCLFSHEVVEWCASQPPDILPYSHDEDRVAYYGPVSESSGPVGKQWPDDRVHARHGIADGPDEQR